MTAAQELESKEMMESLFAQVEAETHFVSNEMPSSIQHVMTDNQTFEDELSMLERQMEAEPNPSKPIEFTEPTPILKQEFLPPTPMQMPAKTAYVSAPPASAMKPASKEATDNFVKNLYTTKNQRSFGKDVIPEDSKTYEVKSFEGKSHFFWFDIQENYKNKSLLHIYGKVKSTDPSGYSNACLTINKCQRNMYFLKRDNDQVELSQAMEEVKRRLESKYSNIMKHGETTLTEEPNKRYAFELSVARGQVQAVKLEYSFSFPPVDLDFEGTYYNGIFGSTYKPSELFVIKQRIMGPCWLQVSDYTVRDKVFTHNQLELSVEDIEDVEVLRGDEKIPPFKVLAVHLTRDSSQRDSPISSIVGLYSSNYNIEAVQENVFHIPLVNINLSAEQSQRKQHILDAFGKNLNTPNKEYALIQSFLQKFNRLDPDIVLGHDIHNQFYEVLSARMQALNIEMTSLLSRSRREHSEMKGYFKQNGFHKIRGFTYGRLVVDTHLSSIEVTRETNYELAYLAERHLNITNLHTYTQAISMDLIQKALKTVDESLLNCHLSFLLAQKFQLVQLTKQLTNVAGCFWYQSLFNQRAERNEMLLMHIFHRNNFIFPDKYPKIYEEGKKAKKREKASYAGGLVLEPKSGLYKDFILLLDFNSLYPSIIQEFKICFTTVTSRDYVGIEFYKRNPKEPAKMDEEVDDNEEEDEEKGYVYGSKIPDYDHGSIKIEKGKNGILPDIVRGLVEKRKQVKIELKNATDKLVKETLDIKQKAVKLIANSIYGCLGFKNSRFYAKQLAALITNYGREILIRTSEQVAAEGFEVVYGDTDSLMINSRVKNLCEAIKKGIELKKKINERYRSKILEIEIDGVFRSLLLLKKKKYAADALKNLEAVMADWDDGKARFEVDIKGLDIVRRDWSQITKTTGDHLVRLVLDQKKDADDVPMLIYEYLENFKKDLSAGNLPLDNFIIYKSLNKAVEQYTEKGQPHVMVAKRMKATMGYTDETLKGHFIPYVICEGEKAVNFAERAYHPNEIAKLKLKPDYDWYCNNQLLNPIVRICEFIQGLEMDRIQTILGVDKRKFNQEIENKLETAIEYDRKSILYSADDQTAVIPSWICPVCLRKNHFTKQTHNAECQDEKCKGRLGKADLVNSTIKAMKKLTSNYYKSLFTVPQQQEDGLENEPPNFWSVLPNHEVEPALRREVSKVNGGLKGLERIYDVKERGHLELSLTTQIKKCQELVERTRKQSAYERIQFPEIRCMPSFNSPAYRHYSIIAKRRLFAASK